MKRSHSMKAVIQAIRRHQRFLVTSHINPEGDALGSALGLASLLKRLGKQVTLATEGGIPRAYRFLPRSVPVIGRPLANVRAEVSMIVDVPTFHRVGSIEKMIRQIPLVVNIDHHVSNQRFADINWVNPKAAAVGEMIYRLYRALGVKPTRGEALCLYVSLVTDTGSFRYMNTTPSVHRIVADLIETGVDPLEVSQELYESHSPSDLKFLGTVLKSLKTSPDGKIAWAEIPFRLIEKFQANSEMVDELVNYPRSIQSAEVALILRQTQEPGEIRVSLRSKGKVDVDRVARRFGGGGHMAASGCTIEGTLAQARTQVMRAVRQALQRR